MSTGRRILVIANPTAGTFNRPRLDRILAGLAPAAGDRHADAVELRLTRRAGDIEEIAAGIGPDVAMVVIAGGDGSINEAIAGFERLAEPPPLALIPFGTANVLACELALPRRAAALAGVIRRGRTAPLHYGRVDGRPFVLMVSAGFDAAVVHSVSLREKRRLGALAYATTAIRLAFAGRSGDVAVIVDGERIICRLAATMNVSRYGGPFRVCPQQSPHRPGLHLVALPRDDALTIFRLGAALLFGRLGHSRDAIVRPLSRCRLEPAGAGAPVPVQVDGDTFGVLPVEVEAAERPLTIVTP